MRSQLLCALRSLRLRGALFLLLSLASVTAAAGEIDRLIVAVNGQAITEGDFILSRNLNSVVSGSQSGGRILRDEDISRLIDLELMRQELKNFSVRQEEETGVGARLQSLRETYGREGGLSLFLARMGLQESELVAYLQLESSILRFVDFRFRPFATVSEKEIADYYETKLAPQLRKAGLDVPPPAQVHAKIEQILGEEKVNTMLEQWIKEIRQNSRIEYFESVPEPAAWRDTGDCPSESINE